MLLEEGLQGCRQVLWPDVGARGLHHHEQTPPLPACTHTTHGAFIEPSRGRGGHACRTTVIHLLLIIHIITPWHGDGGRTGLERRPRVPPHAVGEPLGRGADEVGALFVHVVPAEEPP